jgi:hypothetical protein
VIVTTPPAPPNPRIEDVEAALERVFIGAENAGLRLEDKKKAREITALLGEIARLVRSRRKPVTFVDAAAGKAYLGLLASHFVLGPLGIPHSVLAVERDPWRVAMATEAAAVLGLGDAFHASARRVTDDALPDEPTIVAALHACGEASDAVIDAAIARRATHLLLVPCCVAKTTGDVARIEARVEGELGMPSHGGVRRRLREVLVLAGRVNRLEAAGYATEVVDFVPESVTPYNVLLRARRASEPVRAARAAEALRKLTRA